MWIEEVLGIETNKPGDQSAESVIRSRFDFSPGRTEEFWQLMRPHCDPGNDTPTTATATFDGPEEIRIPTSIDDSHHAVGGNYFGFQQTCGRRSETFRKTSEAPA